MENQIFADLLVGQYRQHERTETQQNIMMQTHLAFVEMKTTDSNRILNIEANVERIYNHLFTQNGQTVPLAQVIQVQGPQVQVPQVQGPPPQPQGTPLRYPSVCGTRGCTQPLNIPLTLYHNGGRPRYMCSICNKDYAETTYRSHVKKCFSLRMCPTCRPTQGQPGAPLG